MCASILLRDHDGQARHDSRQVFSRGTDLNHRGFQDWVTEECRSGTMMWAETQMLESVLN